MKIFYTFLRNLVLLFSSILFLAFRPASEPGTIYIVIGSDTAIWDGMNTGAYNCNYNPALYVNQFTNTTEVMNPAFRGQFRDSFGDTLKLTWWMMAGNIFRYAVDKNIPFPNIMTMYLMKEFHGENVNILGDELSLHYHTFKWTDYNGDGLYFWNQSLNFMECYDDFNFTLSQLFLEEEVFPVSFRSGWHYMDNEWQLVLNKILPYSLHNDYPAKRTDLTEPLDNTYDWSLAPSVFIPYNPSPQNYQIPGDSKGWNVRSIHLNSIKNNNSLLNSIFAKADSGNSQVVCIWGHLPETDFNSNLRAVDSVLHHYQTLYPGVKFKYTTAVKAMQLFRGGTDSLPPVITIQEIMNGNRIQYNISTDEPIFQEQPFVAFKDVNENFHVVDCINTGLNSWSASPLLDKEYIAKAGIVLTDTMGNQAYRIFRYLPDDIYIDNNSTDYQEYYGNWTNNTAYAWGNNSRKAILNENDSVKVSWKFSILQEGINSIHIQFPKTLNHAGKLKFYIHSQTEVIDSAYFEQAPQQENWLFLSAKNLVSGIYTVEMRTKGNGQAGKVITADVIKISPIVREKSIQVTGESINLGEIPLNDSLNFYMEIINNGFGSLSVNEISSKNNLLTPISILPKTIDPFSLFSFKIKINTDSTGIYLDTLIVKSDDPLDSIIYVPFSVKILPYFVIIDNEDTQNYFETSGTWNYSVAQAYGSTSRYASINQNPRGSGYFQKELSVAGEYDISFIVPTTVNAATRALYKIYTNNILTDSLFVNQNTGSGNWVHLKRMNISANTLVKVVISDPGGSQGDVLRTDALKIGIVDYTLSAEENNIVPLEFKLFQNYPNPFNPVTTILYQIPAGTNENKVTVAVYDAIGRRVALLVDEVQSPGVYRKTFDADKLASGIYFCRIHCGKFSSVIKMILIK